MTDRKPDFYRVAAIFNGERKYWHCLKGNGNGLGTVGEAYGYTDAEQARVVRDNVADSYQCTARIVPVYVKVQCRARHKDAEGFAFTCTRERGHTREHAGGNDGETGPMFCAWSDKPKLHDFAWALRRMRVGKRVRRSVWLPDFFLYAKGDPLLLFTVNDSAAALHGHDALATDWELAP